MRKRHPTTRRGRLLAVAALAGATAVVAAGVGIVRPDTGAAQGGDPEAVLDHFRCYPIDAPAPPERAALRDQFEDRIETLAATGGGLVVERICNPVSKQGRPRLHESAHLRCYALVQDPLDPFEPREVEVTNQFGPDQTFRLTNRESLCVPSEKEGGFEPPAPGPAPETVLDHFKCYGAQGGPFPPQLVDLRDQFGPAFAEVIVPVTLCNPVRKDPLTGAPPSEIKFREAHLACYRTSVAPQALPLVRVRNQFEPFFGPLRPVHPADTLCVPSTKRVPPPPPPPRVLDHFKCYEADGKADRQEVTLTDQFEEKRTIVRKPVMICNPVDKNGEGILHPESHLECYEIHDAPRQPRFEERRVETENQFGTGELEVEEPEALCVPSSKTEIPGNGEGEEDD